MRKFVSQFEIASALCGKRGAGRRGGFTLVELLVVILIVGILAGIALPVILPTLDTRRLREASRTVTSYLNGARDTAMRNGRPVGVMFERFSVTDDGGTTRQQPKMSIVLRQVEVPPPYAGDTIASRALIADGKVIGLGGVTKDAMGVWNVTGPDLGMTRVIRPGDLIRFNYQGAYYSVSSTSLDPVDSRFLIAPSISEPWTIKPLGVVPMHIQAATNSPPQNRISLPFQIFRQPVKSANPAMQLPESLVIDMEYSGFNANETQFAPKDPTDVYPVIVMFSPAGHVDRVYATGDVAGVPTPGTIPIRGPIHLLLGKRERLDNTWAAGQIGDDMSNLQDLENFWISIQPQSGLITSSNVGAIDAAATQPADALKQSRVFAESAQALGGR